MSTAFTSYLFKPNDGFGGSPPAAIDHGRTLPAILTDWINVKDYGAKGDGVTDDTAAIRAALYDAWGTPTYAPFSGTPHGIYDNLNRPIFFPAGDYKILETLYVESVSGGWMRGAGSKCTRIFYAGPSTFRYPTTQTSCNCFITNGFRYTRIEGITFEMSPNPIGGLDRNTLADDTVCFNWNWQYQDPTKIINTTGNFFLDVGFKGGTHGLAMGLQYPGGWGEECDATTWIDCWIENCFYGTRSFAGNAINSGWYGGSIKNCNQSGAVGMIFNNPDFHMGGITFDNNDLDISVNYTPAYVTGCKSTSRNFFQGLAANADIVIEGCIHTPTTPGIFCSTATKGTQISIDGCKTNSALAGAGGFYIRDTEFTNSGWASGRIIEWSPIFKSSVPMTFAQLPPIANAAQGLTVSIEDAPTSAWFTPSVTTGSGSNHVLLNASGGSAAGTIAFSAQPAIDSTVTMDVGNPYVTTGTFKNASVSAVSVRGGADAGTGGTNGATTLTLTGGTGTAATFNGFIEGGILTQVGCGAVRYGGNNYTVVPTNPVSITGGPTGATVNLVTSLDTDTGIYTVTGAAIVNGGTGGTNGNAWTLTVVGGTRTTAAILTGVVVGGVLTSLGIPGLIQGGNYTVKPPETKGVADVTSSPAGLTGAKVNISGPDGRYGAGVATGQVFRGNSRAESVDNLASYIRYVCDDVHVSDRAVKADGVGSPHDTVRLTSAFYGTGTNGYSITVSTSPASNALVNGSSATGTLSGGTAPAWTIVGK